MEAFFYFSGPLKFAKLLSKIANYFADLQLPRRDLLRHIRIVDVFVLLFDVGKCRKCVIGSYKAGFSGDCNLLGEPPRF